MDKNLEFVKNMLVIGDKDALTRTELNLMSAKGRYYYVLGRFSGNTYRGKGVTLTERQMTELVSFLKEHDLSLERFLKDYKQQAHNGAQVIKDREIIRRP